MTRVLIFGRSGQLAQELIGLLTEAGIAHLALGRAEIDLSDFAAIDAAISSFSPTAVINAAAYTQVDKAESEPEAALLLNALAPEAMAKACARLDLPFVHISTDYVFSGDKDGTYVEDDPTGPQGVYGATKRDGEERILKIGGRVMILRTAWVFGAKGQNFVRTMLRLAESRDALNVVDDQRGNPTWSKDLALATLIAADRVGEDKAFAGLYHVAGQTDCSWADLAIGTFERAKRHGLPTAEVTRIPTSGYPTPAKRPANSRLSSARFEGISSWRARPWREALDLVFSEILDGK